MFIGLLGILLILFIGFIAGIVCTVLFIRAFNKWQDERIKDTLQDAYKTRVNPENYTTSSDGTIHVDAEIID